MQKLHSPRPKIPDLSLRTLGYWTDNGAYYYWGNAPQVGSGPVTPFEPEDSLRAVDTAMAAAEIPIRYYQLDAWWYKTNEDQNIACCQDFVPGDHPGDY